VMWYGVVRCSAMQCGVMQCDAVWYSVV
jgi:hypothetical protein